MYVHSSRLFTRAQRGPLDPFDLPTLNFLPSPFKFPVVTASWFSSWKVKIKTSLLTHEVYIAYFLIYFCVRMSCNGWFEGNTTDASALEIWNTGINRVWSDNVLTHSVTTNDAQCLMCSVWCPVSDVQVLMFACQLMATSVRVSAYSYGTVNRKLTVYR
jgi:hypothetical protein